MRFRWFSSFVLGVVLPLISGEKGIISRLTLCSTTFLHFVRNVMREVRSRQSTSSPPWPRSRSSWFSYTWVWVCSRGALGSGTGVSSASPSSFVWWRDCLTRSLSALSLTSGEGILSFLLSLRKHALLDRVVPYGDRICHPLPRNFLFLPFGGVWGEGCR